ncbi:hypothetical protein M5K25_016055 [Dendrobium thyrsiflorum]|uniref:Uncharacterized protein n=1 Tax=Dendrobium thyrsiflorum TaxID=117978 RepID=A0ABD0USW6_DENTH
MRANDREISQLNEKTIEMMAQMGAMMQMMQRTAVAGPIPDPPADPPNFQMPQVSGVRGTPEEGHEPTPQNIASTFELVTAAQLEGIITEKIKAIIAVDQTEKLVGKGHPYPAEYDQVPYPKSMKCEQQLEEEYAVQLLMGNIDDKMQPFLCMATITTFQDLIDTVAKFEKLNLSKI